MVWDGRAFGVDGFPVPIDRPAASPEIVTLQGNADGVLVVTEPVLPTVLLDYYVNGVLVAQGQRTNILQLSHTDLARTVPMIEDIDYTVTVWAQNGAGVALVGSAPKAARLNPGVTTTMVTSMLQAGMILTGFIGVGTSMTLDPTGFTITHPDGRQTYFRADGSGNQLVGQAILDALTTLGAVTMLGQTNFLNGRLTLGTGVGDPTSKPGVTTSYDSATFATATIYRRGLHWTGSDWLSTTSRPTFFTATHSTAGALITSNALPSGFRPAGGAVKIGTSFYVLGKDAGRGGDWYVYVYDSAWAKTGEWAPLATSDESLALGIDGAGGLLIAKRTAGGTLYVDPYTVAGVKGASVNCGTAWGLVTLTGIVKAAVDTATVRYVVAATTGLRVFDTTTGARVSGEEWLPAATPVYGLGHDGINWFTHDGATIWKYTNLIGTWDFGFTWVDSDALGAGVAETKISTLRTLAPTKRAKWTISLPSAPPDDGTTDGANTASLYAITTGGVLVRQAALIEGVLSQTFSTLATSGTAPPAANGFAARIGATGRLASVVVDAFSNPMVDLKGDGSWRFGHLKGNADGTNANDSGWVACSYSAGYDTPTTSPFNTPLQVRKDGKLVHIRGFVQNTTATALTAATALAVATVPAGYRPPAGTVVEAQVNGQSAALSVRASIDALGVITLTTGAAGTTPNRVALTGIPAWYID